MNLQLEKYKLLEWLINIEDIDIINRLKKIKDNPIDKSAKQKENVSEIEKSLIKIGLKDYDNKNTFTHRQVMEELKDKYGDYLD